MVRFNSANAATLRDFRSLQRLSPAGDLSYGGEGGIRTREAGISRLHTFQACSFNHSDTSPRLGKGGAEYITMSAVTSFWSLRACPRMHSGTSLLITFCLAWSSAGAASIFQNRTPDAAADVAMVDAPLSSYHALDVDVAALREQLASAPDESAGAPAAEIDLPTAEGGTQHFFVWRTQVMAPGLAARYPQIRSYVARASDQGGVEARIDDSPHGIAAMIRSPQGVTMLQPVQPGQGSRYIVFRRSDVGRTAQPFQCHVSGDAAQSDIVPQAPQTTTGATIRTYRLALAATGEYTQFFGGTVADGLAAIVQAVNRVNGIYLTDFAVQFQLVDNDDQLVFTDPDTDPYTNDDGDAMLAQNQTTVDAIIGPANYDMGHVFSTGGGGVAEVGVACDTSGYKAQGVTGLPAPTGDAFWVDYVAHEMGHQMGALHSFNTTDGSCGGGNRTASQAAEPGSGSTIMAYAGICSPSDLQPHSDAFFHAISLTPIVNRLAAVRRHVRIDGGQHESRAGRRCRRRAHYSGADTVLPHRLGDRRRRRCADLRMGCDESRHGFATGSRRRRTRTVPLIHAADVGNAAVPGVAAHPRTRSFGRHSDQRRYSRRNVGDHKPHAQFPPHRPRQPSWRRRYREHRHDGDRLAAAGPFRVTAPVSKATWIAQAPQTVTWDVANTNAAPVNCAAVDILYSGDGGVTFDTTLASDVPNSGTAALISPAIATAHARVEVLCHGNIFFDISPGDFVVLSDEIFADGFDGS